MRLHRKVLISEATGTAFVRQTRRAERSALATLCRPFVLTAANASLERGPRFCDIKLIKSIFGGPNRTNANIDLLGQVNLLKALQRAGIITEVELRKIAARLAVKNGADIIFW